MIDDRPGIYTSASRGAETAEPLCAPSLLGDFMETDEALDCSSLEYQFCDREVSRKLVCWLRCGSEVLFLRIVDKPKAGFSIAFLGTYASIDKVPKVLSGSSLDMDKEANIIFHR